MASLLGGAAEADDVGVLIVLVPDVAPHHDRSGPLPRQAPVERGHVGP